VSRIPALDAAAAKGAVRLTLVATLVFAIGQVVLDNQNVALFGFFGSFALLVFAQFSGPASARLHAYLGLAAVGFPLIALGTVCSHDAWIAGGTMALVGFAILFSGIVNGYLAASAISAVLLFVLPVMIPAADTQIPDRLAGWAMACAVAIPAALLLWPDRPQHVLRRSIADACRAIVACLEMRPGADSGLVSARAKSALSAAREARRRFSSTPYRPTGATGPTSAIAHLVDDVAWIVPLAAVTPPQDPCFPTEGAEAKEASREVLQASAALLEGQDAQMDLDRLQRSRSAIGEAFRQRLAPGGDGRDDLGTAFDQAFRLRFVSYGVWQIGVQALLAAGRPAPELSSTELEWRASETGFAGPRVTAIRRLIAAYSNANAVWLRNSIRGAVALGAAVLLGQLFDVQHGFWVVLGTLSVLRSNALNTGSTILRALAGTVIGIVIGAVIIIAVGTDTAALWAILPVTLLVAAYAPRAISFAAGQAAFTVAVLTLFDLLQPSGWQVGLIRAEDIAIG
jgi:Fusaric acid resistance protein-like